jgi:hypothetical protein
MTITSNRKLFPDGQEGKSKYEYYADQLPRKAASVKCMTIHFSGCLAEMEITQRVCRIHKKNVYTRNADDKWGIHMLELLKLRSP